MKTIFFTVLLLFSQTISWAKITSEEAIAYYVIHVTGKILINQKDELKRGMSIQATDKVTFKTKDAKAVVISPDKGRFTLAVPTKNQNESFKELMLFISDAILPIKKNVNLSTRSFGTNDVVRDIRNHLGDTTFYIIGDKLSLNIHPEKYPMNEEKFFVLRYVYNGEVVGKKIPFTGNTLIFDKNRLFRTKDDQPIDPASIEKMEIYHYTTNPKSANLLTVFKAVFIDEKQLQEEFKDLAQHENDMIPSGDERITYFKEFFSQIYGNTDKNFLDNWLKANSF